MNNIFERRDIKYNITTFNRILTYIQNTRYHNSIFFSYPKTWNEIMKNPCIFSISIVKKIVLTTLKKPLKTVI